MISGRKRLNSLKEASLDEINLSTGDLDLHLEWVKLNTIINAIELSVEVIGRVCVMVELTKNRSLTADKIHLILRVANLPKGSLILIKSPWICL